jgi:AAA ATPase domain
MVAVTGLRNPYIIGRPVSEPTLFFGRESLFEFVADNLEHDEPVILLHGQRRIGKSSVLSQIPNFLKDQPFVFVSLSLEGKSQKTLAQVLAELARETLECLELTPLQVALPTAFELAAAPELFADRFIPQVQSLYGQKHLVLLFDEFDALGNYSPDAAATHLFPYLHEMIQKHKGIHHIIPVLGRRLSDLPSLLGLFKSAPHYEIGLLDRDSATRLITKPAAGQLHYTEAAIDAILDLSAGHPYFTQVICFALFAQAREQNRWQVERPDVATVVDRAIEIGEGGLAWFWDGLPIPERVFFAAAADIAEMKRAECKLMGAPPSPAANGRTAGGFRSNAAPSPTGNAQTGNAQAGNAQAGNAQAGNAQAGDSTILEPDDDACNTGDILVIKEGEPLALLEESGVILTECLHQAQTNLLEWNYLQRIKRVEDAETVRRGSYRVTIELVRRWLVKRHGLGRQLWELQDLTPEVDPVYQAAKDNRQRGQIPKAIHGFEQVFATNPNHISALFDLAESLLVTKAYHRSILLYERGYLVDPMRSIEGLTQALLGYSQVLADRSQYPEAEKSLKRLLELDDLNDDAQALLKTIAVAKAQPPEPRSWGRWLSDRFWNRMNQPRSGEEDA